MTAITANVRVRHSAVPWARPAALLAFAIAFLPVFLPDSRAIVYADPVPTASPNIDPMALYYSALGRLATLSSAPYLTYVMRQVNRYADDNIAAAMDESVHERRSDRVSFNFVTAGIPKINVDKVSIGRHYLIPDAFLPLSATAEDEPDGMLPRFDPTPTVIATVHTPSNYAISFDGWSTLVGCGNVAHLRLRPLHNPERYNIRELWIRPADYMLCKAMYRSHLYNDDPRHPRTSTVVTATLDANGLIESWTSSNTDIVWAHSLLTYSNGEFFNFSWSESEPDFYFDQKLWDAHVKSLPSAIPMPTPTS